MKRTNKLQATLSYAAASVTTLTPKAGYDKPEVEAEKTAGRETFKRDQEWLVANPLILERLLLKAQDVFTKSKEDSTILQSVLIRDLPFTETIEGSLFTSARALYLLGQTDILDFEKFSNAKGHTYFKIKAGKAFPKDASEVKRVARKAAKKNRRLAQKDEYTKHTRNNKRGHYTFDDTLNENLNLAIQKLQAQALRLYIPSHMTPESVLKDVLNVEKTDVLYQEMLTELIEFDGKTFHVQKSADRALRIYGAKHLDITTKSEFRPFLRLARKRKLNKGGFNSLQRYLAAEAEDLIKDGNGWYVDELKELKTGDYTNALIEVDGNNQGPSIVAALLQDKEWFNKYWNERGAKMYETFKDSILTSLGLPTDTLVAKDVKYKIMTKPYNKADTSNVFGGKAFLKELEESLTPGIILSKFKYFELPLKLQLQQKLGAAYNIEDDVLLDAYKQAVLDVAPFLEQFKLILDDFQKNCAYTPSVWEWNSVDGDRAYAARTTSDSVKVEFIDVYGQTHQSTYQYERLLEVGEWGGQTSLSPTFIASIDAWLARTILINATFTVFTNHDAYFVHANDVDAIINMYKELFTQIADYGNEWLRDMGKRYRNKTVDENTTFRYLAFASKGTPLTSEDILASNNLVGY